MLSNPVILKTGNGMVRITTVPVLDHYDTIYGVSLIDTKLDLKISGKCFSHHDKFIKTLTQSSCVTIKKSHHLSVLLENDITNVLP